MVTYTKPRHGAAYSTGNHRSTKGRFIRAQLFGGQLLHCLVDPKVQARSEGVAQGMQVKPGVKATKSIPLNDLSDRLNSAETGLATQRWVSNRIRGGLSAV